MVTYLVPSNTRLRDNQMKRTWKPIAAGAIDIISGVLGGLSSMLLIALSISRISMGWGEFIPIVCFLFIVPLPAAYLSFAGGIFAARRKRWHLALAGAISVFLNLAITCFLPQALSVDWWTGSDQDVAIRFIIVTFIIPVLVGWAPIVFTALSKNEFK